jgi:transcriptional regulator with XRE-family HTH domain
MSEQRLVGTRIRERRMALGLRQADLAQAVGISPSYLNLIEHNRRAIAGKRLIEIARVLEVEVQVLSSGAAAALSTQLRGVAGGAAVEADRIEELIGRFPGWARLLSAQHARIAALERTVAELSDRLAHDPFLAESLHEMLSTVTAIRATSAILVQTPDIDADWQARFHHNLSDESERLAARAQALVGHFDRMSQEKAEFATPFDALDAFVEARDHHFAALEPEPAPQAALEPDAPPRAAPEDLIAAAAELTSAPARALALRHLHRYAADARALPLPVLLGAAEAEGYDPVRIAARLGCDGGLLLRRLASLPPAPGRPAFGLVLCDGAGVTTYRKALPGFALPRYGGGCALWPLYRALARPHQPVVQIVETPDEARHLAWALCQPRAPAGLAAAPAVEAAMLFRAAPDMAAGPVPGPVQPVGAACRICPRQDCGARREPSILQEGF